MLAVREKTGLTILKINYCSQTLLYTMSIRQEDFTNVFLFDAANKFQRKFLENMPQRRTANFIYLN